MLDFRPPSKLRLAIVEDEPLFRELLKSALERTGEFSVVGLFGDFETARQGALSLVPHVVLLDIDLGDNKNGVALGLELRRHLPQLGIVLLSNHRVPSALSAIPFGKEGGWCYLLKDTVQDLETLRRTLHGAAQGMVILDPEIVSAAQVKKESGLSQLTPRQYQILQLMAQGLTNQGIASELSVSVKSVENHINQLYRELGIDRNDRRIQPRVQSVIQYIKHVQLPHLYDKD